MSINANDLTRFLAATEGCQDTGVDAFIRERLSLRPDETLYKEHYTQYFNDYIEPNAQTLQLWNSLQGTSTRGIVSWLAGGDLFEKGNDAAPPPPQPQQAAAAPAAGDQAPQVDGQVYKPLYTVNAPVPPRLISSNEISSRVQERLNLQQQLTPSPAERMYGVPPAPRGDGWVRAVPRWDPSLLNMSIVQRDKLPREVVVDAETLKQLIGAPELQFPPGPSNPIEGGLPIHGSMVQWVPVDRNQASIGSWMQRTQAADPAYFQTVFQPQWATSQPSYTQASRRSRSSKGEFEAMDKKMGKMSLKVAKSKTEGKHGKKKKKEKKTKKKKDDEDEDGDDGSEDSWERVDSSRTEAKSGSHAARAERHMRSRAELDELMRTNKTIY
jgi:hypothetical protein